MISVIVATFDRSHILQRVLDSFFQQNGLDILEYELIVVDNNSTDDTRMVVDYFFRYPTVRYVFESKQGVSAARNRGVHESKGEIVAFLDDDVVVDKNWLMNLEQCFKETGADVVGGRSYLFFEETPPEWLGPKFMIPLAEVDLGDERRVVSNGTRLFGLNLAIRKEVFNLNRGFVETLGRIGRELMVGEEADLLGKIAGNGRTIVYDPGVIVQHIIDSARMKWDYFTALAVGVSKTREQNELPRNRLYEFLRVGKSLLQYGVTFFWLIKANLFAQSLYEKKLMEFDCIVSKNQFQYRLKRLWF